MIINAFSEVTITCDCGKESYPLFSGDEYVCSCGKEYKHIQIDPISVKVFVIHPRSLELPTGKSTQNVEACMIQE